MRSRWCSMRGRARWGLNSTIVSLAGERAKAASPRRRAGRGDRSGARRRTRTRRRAAIRSPRPACSQATMRRVCRCGSMLPASRPAKRCCVRQRRRARHRRMPIAVRNLSPSGDLVEAAANLFAYLSRARPLRRIRHRRRADPASRPRRGDQRPAGARCLAAHKPSETSPVQDRVAGLTPHIRSGQMPL